MAIVHNFKFKPIFKPPEKQSELQIQLNNNKTNKEKKQYLPKKGGFVYPPLGSTAEIEDLIVRFNELTIED